MSRSEKIIAKEALTHLCHAVRECIPFSNNLAPYPENRMAFYLTRYKTHSYRLFALSAQLKSRKKYRLTPRQTESLLINTLNDMIHPALALLRIGITQKNPSVFFPLLKLLISIQAAESSLENRHHNDGAKKTTETLCEQTAKRALHFGSGNCTELVEATRTYLKIFHVPELKNYSHFECGFDDHVLLVFYNNQRPLPDDFFTQTFSDLDSFSSYLLLHTEGFFADPWINAIADFEEPHLLVEAAELKKMGAFFEGKIRLAYSSHLPCITEGAQNYLSERHQEETKKEKYRQAFSTVDEAFAIEKMTVKTLTPS